MGRSRTDVGSIGNTSDIDNHDPELVALFIEAALSEINPEAITESMWQDLNGAACRYLDGRQHEHHHDHGHLNALYSHIPHTKMVTLIEKRLIPHMPHRVRPHQELMETNIEGMRQTAAV